MSKHSREEKMAAYILIGICSLIGIAIFPPLAFVLLATYAVYVALT